MQKGDKVLGVKCYVWNPLSSSTAKHRENLKRGERASNRIRLVAGRQTGLRGIGGRTQLKRSV